MNFNVTDNLKWAWILEVCFKEYVLFKRLSAYPEKYIDSYLLHI